MFSSHIFRFRFQGVYYYYLPYVFSIQTKARMSRVLLFKTKMSCPLEKLNSSPIAAQTNPHILLLQAVLASLLESKAKSQAWEGSSLFTSGQLLFKKAILRGAHVQTIGLPVYASSRHAHSFGPLKHGHRNSDFISKSKHWGMDSCSENMNVCIIHSKAHQMQYAISIGDSCHNYSYFRQLPSNNFERAKYKFQPLMQRQR